MECVTKCNCGRGLTTEGDQKYGECFKCRISGGIGVTFRGGGGYGRDAFHNGTNAEFLRENDGPGTVARR